MAGFLFWSGEAGAVICYTGETRSLDGTAEAEWESGFLIDILLSAPRRFTKRF
jgi:hypothetical protein